MPGFLHWTATVIVLAPMATGAQDIQPVRIPDEISCVACRITVTPLATMGDDDGPGSLAYAPTGTRVDRQGRYWLFGGKDDGEGPILFAPDGRFLRAIGRKGQGPGEFTGVTDVLLLPGDSVLVMDWNRRGTILGPDLEPRRFLQVGMPLSGSIVVQWPAVVVGFSHYAAGERGGPVLHVARFDSAAARVTHSFGPTWSMSDRGSMERSMQVLADGSTGFWSASQFAYRLMHWHVDGRLDRVLDRRPDWFSTEGPGRMSRDIPPGPSCQAVAEDESGRVWVFVSVAAPTWREAWPRGEGELRVAAFSMEKMYRTMVEVIDPKAGRVVARRQLDEWVIAALPGNRAVVYTATADGSPRLRVVSLRLEGS